MSAPQCGNDFVEVSVRIYDPASGLTIVNDTFMIGGFDACVAELSNLRANGVVLLFYIFTPSDPITWDF